MMEATLRHVGRGKKTRPKLVKVISQWNADRTLARRIEISSLLADLLATDRSRITAWLDLAYPKWKEEGDLDDWWGMGSVFCMELCINVDITVNNLDETITLTLS